MVHRRDNTWSLSCALLAVLTLVGPAHPSVGRAQQLTTDVTTDPAHAAFVYDDVEHFVEALDDLSSDSDSLGILQREYFDRGTPGLAIFIEKYDLTPERILGALRRYPEDYAATATKLRLLKQQEPRFREGYAELARLIPGAAFPPTYFLVGAHRGIGSGSTEGPLVTIGKETRESILGDLAGTLVHEMVHMLQLGAQGDDYFTIFGPEKSLLALCVREGTAEYFAELVTGGETHKAPVREYVLAHERELWERFERDMLGEETGEWLWETPSDPEQPQDVGYLIGARIVETYYQNAADQGAAARDIIAVTDYADFLRRSGYAEAVRGGR